MSFYYVWTRVCFYSLLNDLYYYLIGSLGLLLSLVPYCVPQYTSSGKKVEVAVRAVIHGQNGTKVSAIANPDALQDYAGRTELSGWADC